MVAPSSALAVAPAAGEMALLVMLPVDGLVMIIQTSPLRTIVELEDFIVAEFARVFPDRPALPTPIRIQKCMPLTLVADRRKQPASAQKSDHHSFVELSKTLQVGNAFQPMEQVYVVSAAPAQASRVLALSASKTKTPTAPVAAVAATTAAPAPAPAPAAVSGTAATAPQEPRVPGKRGRKARKASMDAVTTLAAESSPANEPPAKKAKPSAPTPAAAPNDKSTKAPAATTPPPAAAQPAEGEPLPKKKRGRPRKNPLPETASAPPATKKAAATSATAPSNENAQSPVSADSEKSKTNTVGIPSQGQSQETKRPQKRAKTAEVPKPAVDAAVVDLRYESSSEEKTEEEPKKKLVRRTKPAASPSPSPPSASPTTVTPPTAEGAKETAEVAPSTHKPIRRSFQETLAAAKERIEAEKRAAKQQVPDVSAPSTVDKSKEASKPRTPSQPTTASAKSTDKPAKRTFQEILAATRARLDAEKKSSNDETESSTTSDNNEPPASQKKQPAPVKPSMSKKAEDNVSATDDSDFEDAQPRPTPAAKPIVVRPVVNGAKPESSSEDSTDDEGLDYSQSLLADLANDDPNVQSKSASHFLPSKVSKPASKAVEKKSATKKTKPSAPVGSENDIAGDSQGTTTDLSQDLLADKATPEASSLLVSSLSRNRFSLDNMQVPKLKKGPKTSKNPFAAASTKETPAGGADAPVKRPRGRPRKVRE